MYNGYFPQQPMMASNYRQQMPQQMVPQMPVMPQEETLFVPNEQAAEAYLVAPNGFVRLWDANQQVFYEKRADPQGRPFPLEKFEFRKVTNTQPAPNQDMSQFVTRKEFEELKALLEGGKDNV